jgi:riboflavin transporter FmnP
MSDFKSKDNFTTKIKKLCIAALFAALAYAAMFVTSWIKVGFLTFDAKDTVIALAGLILGPVYSLVISLLVAFIELITVGDTGIYGFIMNFLSSAVFSSVCASIYKYKKNIKGAVVGLVSASLSMTAAMLLFNLFITPLYMGVDTATVASMIPTLFLPFNLTKGFLNASLVLVLYKPFSTALKAARLLPSEKRTLEENEITQNKKRIRFSLTVTAVGLVVAALCIFIFFVVLKGEIVI